ncbi:MAG: ABC transporter permease [Deltaproteobacteria bacterium]|nr:MAG: ABC transporter permease [Deltaproteobacteria bacterium]
MANQTASVESQFLRQISKKFLNWSLLRQIMSFVLFIGLWSIIVVAVDYFHQIPTPKAVFLALFELPITVVLINILKSFFRVLAGFFLGIVIGFPIGVAIGYSRVLKNLIFPAFEMIRPIPPIAWIPLTVLFFVHIESQIIFLTFYGAFFPIVYNTMGGIAEVDIRLPRAAMSFGLERKLMLWKVILPAAMPQIFTGMRLAMGITWILVVAAEMMANKGGMGYYVWYNHTVMDYPHVVLGMGIIGLCGAICSIGINFVGNYFTRWRRIF